MIEPLVSVVIPCYNPDHAFLEEAIDSVRAQSYKRVELILVNDGSETLLNLEDHESQVYSIRHSGVASAMNTGARLSHGEFFLCLASDDTLEPTYIEECLKPFHDARVGFVWTAAKPFGNIARLSKTSLYDLTHPRRLLHRWSILRNPGGQTGAALFRKEAFTQAGGYDESLAIAEDWEILIRLSRKGWKGVSIAQPLHNYRFHNRNQRHNLSNFASLLQKYPEIRLYELLTRGLDFANLSFHNPLEAVKRLERKLHKQNVTPDDYEKERIDERLRFGLDIGSGSHKLLGLGCDIRKVTDIQCDMRYLPFKNKAFIITLFRHSLEHVKEYPIALKEASRIAQQVYIILPKKEIWPLDPTHIEPFSLENPIQTFKLGKCYKMEAF